MPQDEKTTQTTEEEGMLSALGRNGFFRAVEKRLMEEPEVAYDMVCLDIEDYNLLMDRYGEDKCEILYRYILKLVEEVVPEQTIIGRVSESQIGILASHAPFGIHKVLVEKASKTIRNSIINGVSVKSGVYLNVNHSIEAKTLLFNAMLAVNTIKGHYDVNLAEYDTSIREQVLVRQQVIDNMAEGIQKRQFVAYYQPKYDIVTEEVVGAEALVRWVHPELGFLTPDKFIDIFEHNGFVHTLDMYMLETVCMDIRRWMDEGKSPVPISVNISQLDFDDENLADEILQVVDRYCIPAELLHFEITESVNASDMEKKKKILKILRDNNFKIELDDFGCGYSSMSALCELPVDILKIDGSLTARMFERNHGAVITGVFLTARELEVAVVVEGIETTEQVQELRWKASYIKDLMIQGFYFNRPLPKDRFENYLVERVETEPEQRAVSIGEDISKIYDRSDDTNQMMRGRMYKALMEVPGTVLYVYDPRADRMSLEVQRENGEVKVRVAEHYLERLHEKNWILYTDLENYIEAIRSVSIYGAPKEVIANSIISNGEYRQCRYKFAAVTDYRGVVDRVVGVAERLSEDSDNSIQENMPVGTFRYEADGEQRFDYISRSLYSMLGFPNEKSFRKHYNNSFKEFVHPEDVKRVLREIDEQVKDDSTDYCEYRVITANGDVKWLYDRGNLVVDEKGKRWFYVAVADLDGYKQAQKKREEDKDKQVKKYKEGATRDRMTGLYNHEYSMRLVQSYMDMGDVGAFFLIDIDNFKQINDTRGHVVGDQVICALADMLQKNFRDVDVVGRYGGDEFVCYMTGVINPDIVMKKATSIMEKSKQIPIDSQRNLSISVGVVADISRVSKAKELVELADQALYEIKKNGKGNFAVYQG